MGIVPFGLEKYIFVCDSSFSSYLTLLPETAWFSCRIFWRLDKYGCEKPLHGFTMASNEKFRFRGGFLS